MRNTYGVDSINYGEGLRLGFVTQGQYSKNVGSRMYMMRDDEHYEMFKLKNREFSVDVDVSNLPCGINGALYFVEMNETGDKGTGSNNAGAKYGTGYCDAQCPHDMKFIKGRANCDDWNPTTAMGKTGICCMEMDIWEANRTSTQVTSHPCKLEGSLACHDEAKCGDGDNRFNPQAYCDKDGCDYSPYRVGQKNFFGENKTVNSSRPMTVVTQFITEDQTDNTDVVEIRRFYVQDGKHIPNPMSEVHNLEGA